jgi:ABC-type sugar transport system permease subunit
MHGDLRRRLRTLPTALTFLLPGLALFLAFVLGPMLYSLRISFYDWKVLNPSLSEWVGLDNYLRALSDPIFRRAVLNTVAYSVGDRQPAVRIHVQRSSRADQLPATRCIRSD